MDTQHVGRLHFVVVPPHNHTTSRFVAPFRRFAAAFCVALMLVVPAGHAGAGRPGPDRAFTPEVLSSTSISGYRTNITYHTNRQRAYYGVPQVRTSSALTNACQAHANDMAKRRVMSHTGSDGSNGGTRATRYGYRWSAWGENVAAGRMSSAQVVSAWMNSSGHRANILNRRFEHIGIGVQTAADGTLYFCMLLGDPM